MPMETRGQAAVRYLLKVVEAVVPKKKEQQEGPTATSRQPVGWENGVKDKQDMAFWAADGRLRFSEKKEEGLTHKQLDLMIKGSLEDRFKKLQKDVGTEPS